MGEKCQRKLFISWDIPRFGCKNIGDEADSIEFRSLDEILKTFVAGSLPMDLTGGRHELRFLRSSKREIREMW